MTLWIQGLSGYRDFGKVYFSVSRVGRERAPEKKAGLKPVSYGSLFGDHVGTNHPVNFPWNMNRVLLKGLGGASSRLRI